MKTHRKILYFIKYNLVKYHNRNRYGWFRILWVLIHWRDTDKHEHPMYEKNSIDFGKWRIGIKKFRLMHIG